MSVVWMSWWYIKLSGQCPALELQREVTCWTQPQDPHWTRNFPSSGTVHGGSSPSAQGHSLAARPDKNPSCFIWSSSFLDPYCLHSHIQWPLSVTPFLNQTFTWCCLNRRKTWMGCQRAKQVYKHTQQRGRQPAKGKNAWRRQVVTRVHLFLSALPRHLGN